MNSGEMGRATGKTFRRLLFSLLHASEGKTVLYTSESNRSSMVCNYFNSARHIAASYLGEKALGANRRHFLLKFPNAGAIYFKKLNDDITIRGIKFDVKLVDD